jgi:hypothetical protein
MQGFPWLGEEDNLGDFPLGRKVSAGKYSVVELGEMLRNCGTGFYVTLHTLHFRFHMLESLTSLHIQCFY